MSRTYRAFVGLLSGLFLLTLLAVPGWAQTISTVAGGGAAGAATSSTLNAPCCVALDGSGNLFIADYNNYRVRKVDSSTGLISTVAGTGTAGFSGDGGAATSAQLQSPYGVAVDASGNLYIADHQNHRIRKVNASTGVISTIAGTGTGGYSGDGGVATSAQLQFPSGVAVDGSGSIYVADRNNHRIRKVNTSTGVISTIAGTGTSGYSGDGGAATSAQLFSPHTLAVDGTGNVYIVDHQNNSIRKVDASTGVITTVAGTGVGGFSGDGGVATSAQLSAPLGVALDGSRNVYISDLGNQRIRKVAASTGIISTVVGTGTAGYSGDGASATSAQLSNPNGVAISSSGDLYVSDGGNHVIRKVDASTATIITYAGGGVGDGGAATTALLNAPYNLVSDGSGNLYIADGGNHRIRKVDATTSIISTMAGTGTAGYSGDGGAATSAQMTAPYSLARDGSGNLYSGSRDEGVVRKVNTSTDIITTAAGTGTSGFSGDGGAATSAQLSVQRGAVVDGSGNLYIADLTNNRVRKVSASTGIITTVAGTGTSGFSGDGGAATSAQLSSPHGLMVDQSGNLYITDLGNNRVRKVDASTGIITTVAGTGTAGFSGDGGAATSAQLNQPFGTAMDGLGNLYVSDLNNHRIRKVDASTGIITTIAGTGTAGFSGDGGTATSAQLNTPHGLMWNNQGLYIADNANNRIRKVTIPYPTLSLPASVGVGNVTVGNTGTATLTVSNTGTATLTIAGISSSEGQFTLSSTSFTVAAGGSQNVTVTFTPTAIGAVSGTLTVSGTGVSNQTVTVTGTGVNHAPTLSAISDPLAILEDVGSQTVNLSGISAGGGESQTLTVTASSSNTSLIPNPTVSYTSANATGSLSYTPVSQASGTATITVTVTDDGGTANGGVNTVTQTFTVMVTGVNDAPTLSAISNPSAILEDAGLQTVSLSGISAGGGESQALTVTATSGNTGLIPNPTVSYTSANATGSLSYTPVSQASGTATITVTVTDDGGTANGGVNTVTQTFTVMVTGVNDAPTLSAISDPSAILEDVGSQTVNLSGISAGGGESQTLTVTASSSNTALIPNPTVSYTSANATGSLSYTPVSQASGTATITVTVTDDGGTANGGVNAVTQTFTVTVTGVNNAPTLSAISNPSAILEDAGLQTVSLSGISAGGGESQTLTVTATSNNTGLIPNPTVSYTSANATGSLSYTPVSQASGTATITVIVTDDGGTANGGVNTVSQTFTVAVNAVNTVASFAVSQPTLIHSGTGFDLSLSFRNPFGRVVTYTGTVRLVVSDGRIGGAGAQTIASAATVTFPLQAQVYRTQDGSTSSIPYRVEVEGVGSTTGTFQLVSQYTIPALALPIVEVRQADGNWVEFSKYAFVGGRTERLRVRHNSPVRGKVNVDISYNRQGGPAVLLNWEEGLPPQVNREFDLVLPLYMAVPGGGAPLQLWCGTSEGPARSQPDGEVTHYQDAQPSNFVQAAFSPASAQPVAFDEGPVVYGAKLRCGVQFAGESQPRFAYDYDARRANGTAGGHRFADDLLVNVASGTALKVVRDGSQSHLDPAMGNQLEVTGTEAEMAMVSMKLGPLSWRDQVAVSALENHLPQAQVVRVEELQARLGNAMSREWQPVEQLARGVPVRVRVEAQDSEEPRGGVVEVGVRIGGQVVARQALDGHPLRAAVALELPAAVLETQERAVRLEPYAVDCRGGFSPASTDGIRVMEFALQVKDVEFSAWQQGQRVFVFPGSKPNTRLIGIGMVVGQISKGNYRILEADAAKVEVVLSNGSRRPAEDYRLSSGSFIQLMKTEEGEVLLTPQGSWDSQSRKKVMWSKKPTQLGLVKDRPSLGRYQAADGSVWEDRIFPFVLEVRGAAKLAVPAAELEAALEELLRAAEAGEQGAGGLEEAEQQFGLLGNYPNPFNPSTCLRYRLDDMQEVRLAVYNVVGQRMRVLVDKEQGPGEYEVEWNGLDDAGQMVGVGIYFYQLQAGQQVARGRMLLLK